jgi:hypothetical protein
MGYRPFISKGVALKNPSLNNKGVALKNPSLNNKGVALKNPFLGYYEYFNQLYL